MGHVYDTTTHIKTSRTTVLIVVTLFQFAAERVFGKNWVWPSDNWTNETPFPYSKWEITKIGKQRNYLNKIKIKLCNSSQFYYCFWSWQA